MKSFKVILTHHAPLKRLYAGDIHTAYEVPVGKDHGGELYIDLNTDSSGKPDALFLKEGHYMVIEEQRDQIIAHFQHYLKMTSVIHEIMQDQFKRDVFDMDSATSRAIEAGKVEIMTKAEEFMVDSQDSFRKPDDSVPQED